MKVVDFYYIVLPLIVIIFLIGAAYLRITGDLEVCEKYYPEMSLARCYFSAKTVRVPGGGK